MASVDRVNTRNRRDAAARRDRLLDRSRVCIDAGEVDEASVVLGMLVADLATAMRLFVEHDTLGMFDAVLAAVTMSSPHTTGLMSADSAFASIDDLSYLVPGIDPDV